LTTQRRFRVRTAAGRLNRRDSRLFSRFTGTRTDIAKAIVLLAFDDPVACPTPIWPSMAASPRSSHPIISSCSARSHYFVKLTMNAVKLTLNLAEDFGVLV
jgi:hypothetical protein